MGTHRQRACTAWDLMKFMIPHYGADLTVIEESEELLERLASGENLPLFTSCTGMGKIL